MAMVIAHNSSAAMALNELNKNNNRLSKDLKKVSSGVRITGAGDGASEYSISEKMRTMIRALDQDIENSKKGKDIIKVAEGGIQSIIEELRTLKELALNSANDHNADFDRAILQKEFDQRMENIDNIAEETNYNGKLLLNGTYQRKLEGSSISGIGNVISSNTVTTTNTTTPVTTSTTSTSVRTSAPITNTTRTTTTSTSATMPTTGTTEGTPVTTTNTVHSSSIDGPTATTTSNTVSNTTTTEDATTIAEVRTDTTTSNITNTTVATETDTTTTTTTKVSTIVSATEIPGSGDITLITNGMTELTEDGIYQFADDYTGNLTINADDVTILGANSTLSDVYITDNGNNLYLKNVNISNTQDKTTVDFPSSDGKLHIISNTSITATNNDGGYGGSQAIIHSMGHLSVVGDGILNITRNGSYFGAAAIGANVETRLIGTDAPATCGNISIGDGLTLNFNEQTTGQCQGASIGGAYLASCGDISIGSNTNITITRTNSNCVYSATGIGAGLGDGYYNPSIMTIGCCGDITVFSDAVITINTSTRSGAAPSIGTASYCSKCGDIEIYSGVQYNLTTQWSSLHTEVAPGTGDDCVLIGSGPSYCSCGDITICTNTTRSTLNTYGEDYGASNASTCGTVELSAPTKYVYSNDADTADPSAVTATTYNVTTETITTTTTTTTINETKTTTYETSTETREDVTTTVYEKTKEEIPRYNAPLIIHTGTKANEQLRVYIEDMGPKALGIMGVVIDPREAAESALEQIDNAIEYALEQATQMGAYISRLEMTEENLVTANENTQGSESTIRDANMAKEMMSYTRDNILTQSAQAMLAQANQNASSVLSLLQ